MDRLLARLERSLGRFAIPNLIFYVVGGMALVWAMSFARPGLEARLVLDLGAVRRGEVWRLVTFLFLPLRSSPLWMMVNLYFIGWVGSSLEQHWGAFKFNVYYFTGALAEIVAAYFTGEATNVWLNDASLLLAFATLFPDVEILLFFVLPVRVKWLGILAAAPMALLAFKGGWATRASIFASLTGYALFFSGHWWSAWRARGRAIRRGAERREQSAAGFGRRVCAICGAQEADGADIRVCSCEKCGNKPRCLCLEHARNH
jgi:hypothetical protein